MRLDIKISLFLLLTVLMSFKAVAQEHRQPTLQEERAAPERHRMPTDAELQRSIQSTPRLDVDAQAVNIEALAREFDERRKLRAEGLSGPALYVFVTLAMPEASLKALIPQAERASATLVVRGLVDRSIRKTAERVATLIGKHQVAWLIDPEAFGRYQVSVAPTIILDANPKSTGCAGGAGCQVGGFAKIAGDVRLAYALKAIRNESPTLANAADLYLRRLGE